MSDYLNVPPEIQVLGEPEQKKPRALVILSGGLDSTVLLYWLISLGFQVEAFSFDYGQRHYVEIEKARLTCHKLGIKQTVFNMMNFRDLVPTSSQTGPVPVPEGHYEEESMKATVVPNRNMVMLSIAASYALAHDIPFLYYGAHSGDHEIYPDCRPEFVASLGCALSICDWNPLTLKAPFLDLDKGDIVKLGVSLGVPFQDTHTCYKGGEKACGKCGSCRERLDAFANAGVDDPIEYAPGVER